MGLEFKQQPVAVNETFPQFLAGADIPVYLAKLKAQAYGGRLEQNELLITADTVVWHRQLQLGKPANREDAKEMLEALSGDWHKVITAVCCTTKNEQRFMHETTRVKFRELLSEEINYYIDCFKPFDKAGSYGIQEWIGLTGISEINGSYTNVVGLPTASLYELLRDMAC
jgi:septum formation protein